jgi:NTP pyrophosphatase (non-canonical NTP hydrolase)
MKFEDLQNNTLFWAEKRGILAHSSPTTQFVKLAEEFGELAAGLGKQNREQVSDSLGDMLVVMILLAHLSKMDLLDCLEDAYQTIKDRTGTLNSNGIFVKEGDGPSVKLAEGEGHD